MTSLTSSPRPLIGRTGGHARALRVLRRSPEQDERLARRRRLSLQRARRSLWISLASIAGFLLAAIVGSCVWYEFAA